MALHDQHKRNAAPASGELPSIVANSHTLKEARQSDPQQSGRQKLMGNRQGMPQLLANDSTSKGFKIRGGQIGTRPSATRTNAQTSIAQLQQ